MFTRLLLAFTAFLCACTLAGLLASLFHRGRSCSPWTALWLDVRWLANRLCAVALAGLAAALACADYGCWLWAKLTGRGGKPPAPPTS